MKTAAVFGAVLASVALFAGPAAAHKVPKTFECVPIEGTSGSVYNLTRYIWFTTGEFADKEECLPGYVLFDPVSTLLTIQDDNTTASGGKASGS
jgi:hypothetical protein